MPEWFDARAAQSLASARTRFRPEKRESAALLEADGSRALLVHPTLRRKLPERENLRGGGREPYGSQHFKSFYLQVVSELNILPTYLPADKKAREEGVRA